MHPRKTPSGLLLSLRMSSSQIDPENDLPPHGGLHNATSTAAGSSHTTQSSAPATQTDSGYSDETGAGEIVLMTAVGAAAFTAAKVAIAVLKQDGN